MKTKLLHVSMLCAFALSLVQPSTSRAQTYTVLRNLSASDGANPVARLTLSGDTLYGTTYKGGSGDCGTVFKMNTDGTGYSVLWNFTSLGGDGANPAAGLVLSGNSLYGTTVNGGTGYGTVFKVDTNGGSIGILTNFSSSDGANPYGGLILSDGVLYGTTVNGGSAGYGTVFKLNLDGTGFAVLKNFNSSDGANPYAGLTFSEGVLYGTTTLGGSSSVGMVFKINTDGSGFNVLTNLSASIGANPYAGVTLLDGQLFGTTRNGGNQGFGTVFRVGVDGMGYTVLRNFNNGSPKNPHTGLTLTGNMFFGVTSNSAGQENGAVYKISPDGTVYATVTNLNVAVGSHPLGDMIFSGSVLYGTTKDGGSSGNGVIFSLNLAPVITTRPVSITTNAGSSVRLSVSVNGDTPLIYQWRKDGADIPDKTNSVLSFAAVHTSYAADYTVVITNAYGAVTSTVATLTVTCPEITMAGLGNGTVGVAYSADLSASGGAAPYTYMASGILPLGLELSSEGLVSGTPTNAGLFNFTATVTDIYGCTSDSNYMVNVVCPEITLSPEALSSVKVLSSYSQTLSAALGTAPYTFAVTDGDLPTGVTLATDGILAGEPDYPGVYNFTVTASDAYGCTGSSPYTLLATGDGNRLMILTNGVGWLKAKASKLGTPTNTAVLLEGSNYTITAYCPSNHMFSNWVAVVAGVSTNVNANNKHVFSFQSNLVLIATFTTNRFYEVAGKYNGLFYETGEVTYDSAGFANVKVVAKKAKPGTFSGSLQVAGEKLPITGKFDAAGDGWNTKRITSKVNPATTYTVRLHLPFDGSDTLTGSVSNNNDTWSTTLLADRQTGVSNYAAQYTMLLPGNDDPTIAPGGDGYSIVTVKTNGFVKLTGGLGDGTIFNQNVPVSKGGDWPLFTAVYWTTNWNELRVKACILMGWMNVSNGLEGKLDLIKTPVTRLPYPYGFTNQFVPLTSLYTNSALVAKQVIELTQGSNGVMVFSGGNLATDITNQIALSTLNKFVAPITDTAGGTNKLKLSVSVKTGKLTGSFKPDGVIPQAIAGAVLQESNLGGGYFKLPPRLGPTNSGVFLLEGE